MLSTTPLSTQPEVAPHLPIEGNKRVSERAFEARLEYRLAKQELESFAQVIRSYPLGTDDVLILKELAERERRALLLFAQALQEYYDNKE